MSLRLSLQFQAVMFHTVWGRHVCSKETLHRGPVGGIGVGRRWGRVPAEPQLPATVPGVDRALPRDWVLGSPTAPLAAVTLLAWTQWGLDRMDSPQSFVFF